MTKRRFRVVADENIPLAGDAFAALGEVKNLPGRKICRKDLMEADILLVRSITKVNSDLLGATNVKFVASSTIGIDHIDLEYLAAGNIGFAYAPGSNADSVAEYVLAALSVIVRRSGKKFTDLTLGIIGVGNIGSRVSRHAASLGIRTMLCDPPKKRQSDSDIYLPLEEVLAGSDVITIHVPLNISGQDRTEKMVEKSFIDTMKPGAWLINTSRGKVVDEASLLIARDRLGGLIIDVWCNEPSVNTALLSNCDIATPHIAGYSFDGKIRGVKAIYDAACAYFFLQPEWEIPERILKETAGVIDIGGAVDPVVAAVLKACPIEEDDRRMKRIPDCAVDERAAYFDELRASYPKRSEFFHYEITAGGCSTETINVLRSLGFRISPE